MEHSQTTHAHAHSHTRHTTTKKPPKKRLVGVARVPRVDPSADWFLNLFLMLPTDALAVMEATLAFE